MQNASSRRRGLKCSRLPCHCMGEYFPGHASEHSSLSAQERENKIIGEVLQRISDDHPKRDDLMQAVKDESGLDIRQFIIDKKIVSLKSERQSLKVIPQHRRSCGELFGCGIPFGADARSQRRGAVLGYSNRPADAGGQGRVEVARVQQLGTEVADDS